MNSKAIAPINHTPLSGTARAVRFFSAIGRRFASLTLLLAGGPMLLAGGLVHAQPPDNERPAKASHTERASSDPDRSEAMRLFESKIRPLLAKHCYECHSSQKGVQKSGLALDSRHAARSGGKRGPAVVPGDPVESWLLRAISHADPDLKMPPGRDKLPEDAIADVAEWIQMGAVDPRVDAKTSGDRDDPVSRGTDDATGDHWAYAPVTDPDPPSVESDGWAASSIDRFVFARLQSAGLNPSGDATPETLLRRLHFDLVGLPPSIESRDAFLKSVTNRGVEAALADETDRLLESDQFGERWGRHWLDVARYGESSGKEANISFPHAWRYRDYVIDAFQDDVPFDRFLTEQIAGDLLPFDSDRERERLLIATGFLAIGPKNLDAMNPDQFRADLIDEQLDTVTRAVIGSSVACARCHDHKSDPFTMHDYYALAGIFSSTETYFGTAVSPANRVGGDPLRLPELPDQHVFHDSIPAKRVEQLKDELASLRQEQKEGRRAAMRAAIRGEDPSEKFSIRDALRIFWRTGAIDGQLDKVDDRGNALPLAMGVLDRDSVGPTSLLRRGEVGQPGDPVPRRMPTAIEIDGTFDIPDDQSGRMQLARWLTDPQNPLTARVYVNRVWKHLMGSGLVATVDNFGTTGHPPSHPDLLDDLATRFVQEGWSTKRLIRSIVLSRTYRQSSEFREQAFEADPDNRLRWRMPKRRLEAEAIRDAMLATSGELDAKRPDGSLIATVVGDRPISLIGLNRQLPSDLDGATHRSVYLPAPRDRLPDVLELFDAADPSFVTGDRETTNAPLQGLYLLNSDFVRDRASALARRLSHEAGDDNGDLVGLAFRICFARDPVAAERRRVEAYLEQVTAESGRQTALTDLCQVLFGTGEFRFLD